MRNLKSRLVFFSGLTCLLTTVGIGTFHAFNRGGNDFSVFYQAWQLVSRGQGHDIYRLSPDRFLYSPGFAWIFSPLGLLPRSLALALWCLLKVFLFISIIKKLSEPQLLKQLVTPTSLPPADPWLTVGISLWASTLITRPLLIDFEYGQVNLLILASCVWGLLGHSEKKSFLGWDIARWTFLTCMAIAKLITLPLLLVPFVMNAKIAPAKLKYERLGIFFGIVISLALPLFDQGIDGTWQLFHQWKEALLSRGLPMESHNQSFTALLYHYFSGQPTHIIANGPDAILLGGPYLSAGQITLGSLFWTLTSIGLILGWLICASNHSVLKWTAVLIGLLIVPSHLIWKPYFVMSLPLAIIIFQQRVLLGHQKTRGARSSLILPSDLLLALIFMGLNFTGFDFVGHSLAAYLEAASLFLFIHLFMIGIVVFNAMERLYRSGNLVSARR